MVTGIIEHEESFSQGIYEDMINPSFKPLQDCINWYICFKSSDIKYIDCRNPSTASFPPIEKYLEFLSSMSTPQAERKLTLGVSLGCT